MFGPLLPAQASWPGFFLSSFVFFQPVCAHRPDVLWWGGERQPSRPLLTARPAWAARSDLLSAVGGSLRALRGGGQGLARGGRTARDGDLNRAPGRLHPLIRSFGKYLLCPVNVWQPRASGSQKQTPPLPLRASFRGERDSASHGTTPSVSLRLG